VRGSSVISSGCNGTEDGEAEHMVNGTLTSKPEAFHAEEMCIAYAARYGISVIDAHMYTTKAPCFKCARLIALAGIAYVSYQEDWWDKEALEFLASKNVRLSRISG
jgi:deoxycytidylate deaminase